MNKDLQVSVIVFAGASKTDENGQLGLITGLVFGDMSDRSTFHTLSWLSHKSRRPVKRVPAAEILASSEGIDEGKIISGVYTESFNSKTALELLLDSKDLFASLSTQRLSVDRSIRGDVASIRFDFQTGSVQNISWIPGKINLADVLTKKNSALCDMLQLLLETGKL